MAAVLKTTHHGGCPHDCPDTCSMVFEVEEGKLVGVKGNPDHPMTRGCLLYTSPSPRDQRGSRMPSSA